MSTTLSALSLIEQIERDGKRGLVYHFHPGQKRAWDSDRRIVAVIAGTRAGKTSWGVLWLHREIARCGPGDYLVAAPSYPILDKAAAPEIESVFGRLLGLGSLRRSPLQFAFSEEGCQKLWGRAPERRPRIIFGHAEDPDSLEAMSARAAWLDEAGQSRFRIGSWEAVQRRLSLDRGRCLVTSTPYILGWLKQKLYDPWKQAKDRGEQHPEIEVVGFDSTMNPAFPREEFERARRDLPAWKFNLFYRGIFDRPAGQIYDNFDPARHVVPRFRVPQHWPRYLGLDFGSTNTAVVFFAEEVDEQLRPSGKLYLYREYLPGKGDPKDHVKAILEGEPRLPVCVGGSASEDEWRSRFASAGLPVREPPVRDVEVGIDTVYAAHAAGKILVFEDLQGYLEQKTTYSRVLNDRGEPTDVIENKSEYHYLDAERYIISWLHRSGAGAWSWKPAEGARSEVTKAPLGVFGMPEQRGRNPDW